MKRLISKVPGHEGDCTPVWVNTNQLLNRMDGGISGFFVSIKKIKKFGIPFRVKTGKEFHGIARNGYVYSSKEVY